MCVRGNHYFQRPSRCGMSCAKRYVLKVGARTNADKSETNADTAFVFVNNTVRVSPRRVRVSPRFLLLVAAVILVGCGEDNVQRGGADVPKVVQIPDSVRIRVEVINTTTQRGLGRRAMFFLRDQGFDVVRYASGSPPRDSSQVIDRSGHRDWAELVAKALGVSRVVVDVDSGRYLDVSVLLGRDWRAPAKPFYP
jgi:LytR cell envelope-related transcriptional attenuator